MRKCMYVLLAAGTCLGLAAANAQKAATPEAELSLPASCGRLRISAIARNALRVRCGRGASPLPELIYTRKLQTASKLGEDPLVWWIATDRIRATVDKQTKAIRFYDGNGALLTEEETGGRSWTPSGDGQHALGTSEVRYRLQADEHLYGSGQFQDGYLDIARLPRRMVQLNTQISIPFLLSSKGYGLLWHQYSMTTLNEPNNRLALTAAGDGQSTSVDVTTSAGTQKQTRTSKQFVGSFQAAADGSYALQLDLGRTMTDRWFLQIDGKPVVNFQNYWLPGVTSAIVSLSAGDHQVVVQANAEDRPTLLWGLTQPSTTLRSADSTGLDYTVFSGSANEVIASYRQLSGGTPMFPKWAFGFIQCRERYHSSAEILDALHEFRKDQLPVDVMVQDWQYWGKYGWNAMRFDEQNYPDPAKLVNQVHEDHAHLMVSVWSRFDPASEVGKLFQAQNLFIPGTSWVDFFNPAAANLYWQNFSTRMRTLGIDAWWLDATEPENDDLSGRQTHAGSGNELRLVYPLLVTKTVYEGSRKDAPDRRSMILTRSAYLGEQRYGVSTWSGDIGSDWETLKRQVVAGLDYAASGMPYWTTDTGGFFRPGKQQYTDPAYHERFLRWLEFSAFSPLMRVHGYQTDTEPWNYGPEMVTQERQIVDLRYRFLPYIYSQAAATTNSGSTLMRPLVMNFPQDAKALAQKYEYMFGPSLLVAPVLQPGVTEAHVYAPSAPGGWYDWWTGKAVPSNSDAVVPAPVTHIPLLVKAGSVLPLGPVQQYVGQVDAPTIELRVYAGANGATTLYDDDGTTYAYEQGRRSLVRIAWDDTGKRLSFDKRDGSYPGMALQQDFHVRLVTSSGVVEKQVSYRGRRLQISF